jgi:hypothetical protein
MVSRRRATTPKARRSAGGRAGPAQEEAVVLRLSSSQVEQVLRAATSDDGGGGRGMLSSEQLASVRARRYQSLLDDRRLSRSLLAGLLVLTCFPAGGDELGIADLARKLDMRTSTIHRYVSTLLAAGLLERDPVSRQYRLAQP